MPTHSDLPPLKPPPKPDPKYDVPTQRPWTAQRAMWIVIAAIMIIIVVVFLFL